MMPPTPDGTFAIASVTDKTGLVETYLELYHSYTKQKELQFVLQTLLVG